MASGATPVDTQGLSLIDCRQPTAAILNRAVRLAREGMNNGLDEEPLHDH